MADTAASRWWHVGKATLAAYVLIVALMGAFAWVALEYREYEEYLEVRRAKHRADTAYVKEICSNLKLMYEMRAERECDARTHSTHHSPEREAFYDLVQRWTVCGAAGCAHYVDRWAPSALTVWVTLFCVVLVLSITALCLLRCGGRPSYDRALPSAAYDAATLRAMLAMDAVGGGAAAASAPTTKQQRVKHKGV